MKTRLGLSAVVSSVSFLLLGFTAVACWADPPEGNREPKRSSQIKYINPQIPKVTLPGYQGQRYEARVPDTLDLAERAALAVNGLTGPTDPQADYELYWMVDFFRNPPVMWHDWNDWCQVKFP